jgi:hypothetical protein
VDVFDARRGVGIELSLPLSQEKLDGAEITPVDPEIARKLVPGSWLDMEKNCWTLITYLAKFSKCTRVSCE